MIPDVPRSLREQLMKENMMLMEFLLNQDQEARAKSPSPKRSIPRFNANIDIVVEAPPEDVEEQRVEEERVEINLDETRRSGDSEPEVGKSLEEVEENGQETQRGEGEDEVRGVEVGEIEKDGDRKKEDGNGENKQEEAEGKEKVAQSKEEQKEVDSETVEKEDFIVDLDAIMSELGLLGEREPCAFVVYFFGVACVKILIFFFSSLFDSFSHR